MSQLPELMKGDRVKDAVLIPVLGILQAVALGFGAFATRDAFTALHDGTLPSNATLAWLFGAGATVAALAWLMRLRAEAIGQSYATALRRVLYAHIAGMSLSTLEKRRVGALSLRFVGDLSAARNWFGQGLPPILSALVVLPGAATVLYLLDPRLMQMAVVPLALTLAMMTLVAIGLQARHRKLRTRRANISISMMERIAIAPQLDLMGRTGHELDVLDQDGASLREDALARIGRASSLRFLVDIGAGAAAVLVFLTAGRHGIAPGTVAASLAIIAILVTPLKELAGAWDRFCAWRVARGKAETLLQTPSQRRRVKPLGRPVSVRIDGHRQIFVSAGDLVALPADADDDLLRLIAGIDHSASVRVHYDDLPAGDLPAIAYLGHQAPVLQGTLRRAVTLGLAPRPSKDKVLAALKAFGIAHLADGSKGLRQRVSEGARNLSVAEALRLELTRAVLGAPDLILIEAHRLAADPNAAALLRQLRQATGATIIVRGIDIATAWHKDLRVVSSTASRKMLSSRPSITAG